ncbi:DNA-binding transcriptional regulator, MarR family [Parafrankia irregularis]|uniref:DNA-binding transcriptional regulator, MarR family n=1 Tax=Parafrankia irregularis TaxID=795642 RepID=A0A0S4QYC4_9ACTN|nr:MULTISPECIES: MarR family transcriptional regulator [Parafrankia]MBE3204880.1 MarR family transcriptional regulator [Parafrankia sp. CH37]CUU60651.1 DNA-binding transcriptional regulator, MarR family [Parafrankia irregularis]
MIHSAGQEAWLAIQVLIMAGEGQRQLHRVCQEVDLPPGALKVLLVLCGGPRPMRELVGFFQLDPSYITSMVDALERRGVARREPHPTDRRAKTVAITEDGRKVVERARELMTVPPQSFDVLSAAEQQQLLALLLRVLDAEMDIPDVMRPRPTA